MFIEHRKSSRQTQTDWTDVAVGFFTKASGAAAEHFAVRLDLTMDLESDGNDVI